MSFRSLSEMRRAFYATSVPVSSGTRTPITRGTSVTGSAVRVGSGKAPTSQPSTSGIDHWSIVLFYSMGIGVMAVSILLFLVLMAVWLYGQFVWTFTRWDLANVRLTPYKSLAYLILGATFAAGTGVGLWCFSGAAWRLRQRQSAARGSSSAAGRKTR
jgi:hypothetical protein